MIIQLLLKFISCFYSSSMIYRVLNDITTKYVLMIDSSVEFTHNSNLPRMLALLQSNQVSVVSPMTEDAVSQTLSSNCFQVYISSDSSKTIQYIRNQTKNEFPVVESLLFEHGHYSSHFVKKKYVNVMRKVISDMYYMSISDYLLVSWQSSLGRMMCYLAEEGRCDTVLNWKIENKKIEMK